MNTNKTLLIGIDPGVHTGFAIYCSKAKQILELRTTSIIPMLEAVKATYETGALVKVRFEDARIRSWFGNSGREKLQGAGSIKRDCSIIEEFLQRHGIPYEKVAPKHNRTKLSAETFNKITGWKGKSSEHARDAGMLVFGI